MKTYEYHKNMHFMFLLLLFTFCFLLARSDNEHISRRSFPQDFLFGVATSAYQIEGAWNESGKGPSIWDIRTHKTPSIFNGSNGDIACDSYHKIDEDIAMLKYLGVNFYRFSISWSRIAPTGIISEGINQRGVQYYNDLLDELQQAGIEAMVTLYHSDAPQNLFEKGLFLNESFNQAFVDYARFCFETYGPKVKYWITINQPALLCSEIEEEFSENPGIETYLCVHNFLLCHALVYRMYEKEFKNKFTGFVTIIANSEWNIPERNIHADKEATERKFQFQLGWIMHPLIFGDYPDIMKTRVRKYSTPSKSPSRLPEFTEKQKKLIKGSLKFVGLNFYSTVLIGDERNDELDGRSHKKDLGVRKSYDSSWEQTACPDIYIVYKSTRDLINRIYKTYNIPIFITENGYTDLGTLADNNRINFLKNGLSKVLEAIYIDKVKIIGYTYWSLMDNFEWFDGYWLKYGLYHVNFTSATRERTKKKSADYFKKIIKTRCLVEICD